MTESLFFEAYPFARRAVEVRSAKYARALRATGLDRDDLEQELLVELFRALSRFDPFRASLSTYVERVIAAKAISVIRRERAQKRCKTEEPPVLRSPDLTINVELRVDIRRTLMPLSKSDRRIARLLLWGQRPTEIARELGSSRAAVYRSMDRIRDALRKHVY